MKSKVCQNMKNYRSAASTEGVELSTQEEILSVCMYVRLSLITFPSPTIFLITPLRSYSPQLTNF